MNTIYCNGTDIYNAAIAGAAQGYSKSTDDCSAYKMMFQRCFDELFYSTTKAQQKQMLRKTQGRWQNAVFALTLAMQDTQRHGEACEAYGRVFLNGEMRYMFDITLRDWKTLQSKNVAIAHKQAA
jgi:hypothetical protein